MSAHVCTSKTFPCPAGERCPEQRAFVAAIERQEFKKATKLVIERKAAATMASKDQRLETLAQLKPTAPTTKAALALRDGLFLAASRATGETYMEPALRKLLSLKRATTGDHDGQDAASGAKFEIKVTKMLGKKPVNKQASLFDVVALEAEANPLERITPFAERASTDYDANIQNVKRDHFDQLVYVLMYEEGVEVFKIKSADINRQNIANWSEKHGRYDQPGKSGQFNVTKNHIKAHEENFFYGFYSYEELVPVFKDLGPAGDA